MPRRRLRLVGAWLELYIIPYQSLKATDAKDEESIPNSVNEQSRRLTRSIVNRVKRTVPVVLDVPGQDLVRIEANPQESYARPRVFHGRRREVITAWGAVDGELDMISVRRRAYFVIYEHGSNNQIRCTFPDDWMETVKDMLARRVIVEGNLRYRTDGTVRAMAEPSSINPVPEPRRTIIEFRGALPGCDAGLGNALLAPESQPIQNTIDKVLFCCYGLSEDDAQSNSG